MSKSLDKFIHLLRRIRPYLDRIDWEDAAPTPPKAFVCAVMSKIAYLVIPEFEVRNHALAKVIPCLTYQELVASGVRPDLRELLLMTEISNDVFVDPDPQNVASVIIRAPRVIFVCLRGTRPLYLSDWLIDLRVPKADITVGSGTDQVRLHSGFFLAISQCLERIAKEVRSRTSDSSVPVYVVGHSLGGAMAAIAFALDGVTFFSKFRYGVDTTVNLGAHSSYTYGMPRYGDANAIDQLSSPFHIYNGGDLVPTVPPRWLGFSNVPYEFLARGSGKLIPKALDRDGFRLRGVRHHLMERYIQNLEDVRVP